MKRIPYFFMLPLLGIMLISSIPAGMLFSPTVECIVIQCRTIPPEEIEGAWVAIYSVSANDTVASGSTGNNGSFIGAGTLTVGDYAIHVSKPGYISKADSLKIDDENGQYMIVVCLEPGLPEL